MHKFMAATKRLLSAILIPFEIPAVSALLIGIAFSFIAWLGVSVFIDQKYEQGGIDVLGRSFTNTLDDHLGRVQLALATIASSHQAVTMQSTLDAFRSDPRAPVRSLLQIAWAPRIADRHSDHYPITKLSGAIGAPLTDGSDLAAIPSYREGLQRARDLGELTVIRQDDALQHATGGPKYLAILPRYRDGAPHSDRESRRNSLEGFAIGVISLDAAVKDMMAQHNDLGALDYYIFDAGPALDLSSSTAILSSKSGHPDAATYAALIAAGHSQSRAQFGDRSWIVVGTPNSTALRLETNYDETILVSGLLLTALLAFYLQVAGRRRRQLAELTADLKATHVKMQAALERTQAQTEAISQLSLMPELLSGEVEAVARIVTEVATRQAGCERANVWLFNAEESVLHCIDLYEATPARHSSGLILSEEEFGHELAILKEAKYVALDDPLTDPRAKGYVEPYLKPLGITSMLDTVIQAGGVNLGLLCFEHVGKAHHWEADEITFAHQLADKIRLAIVSRRRHEAYTALDEAQAIAHIGSWQADLVNYRTTWSDECYRIFGVDRTTFVPTYDSYVARIFPDDRAALIAAQEQSRKEHTLASLEQRVLRADGTIRFVQQRWTYYYDENDKPERIIGTIQDITDRKLAEAALRQRNELFSAVAESAASLVTSPSIDDAIHASLAAISKVLRVDRIVVLERPKGVEKAVLRYLWEGPAMKPRMNTSYMENSVPDTPETNHWLAPLQQGRIVLTDVRTASSDVRKLCEQLEIKKNLIVPIMVDAKYWGQIGLDSIDQERVWADFEIELIQTLAELIGSAVRREHYIREITDANRIVQNSPTILYRLRGEPTLPLIYVSQNVRLLGHDPAALIASPQLYQSLIHKDDMEKFHDLMIRALEAKQGGTSEFRIMTSHGDFRWVEDRFTPIRDSAGRLVEIEGLLIDVTERKAAEEKIALLARTDPLTGLANRATFIEQLRQAFAAGRRGSPAFAVLYLDLDRFKDINDTLGHPIGDQLLIEASKRLKNGIRENDVVARLGGDEFAILQAELNNPADAGTLAAKLRAELSEPLHIAGNELRISASIGIATYTSEATTPEDLLAQADIALYRAKEEGRDQYRFHTEELDVQVREQVAIAGEIREALSRGEFELYYQPQVELSTNRIVGMEALIRWNHPKRGLLLPSAFIDIAERTGAMIAMGQWTLEHACQQMSEWRKAGIAPLSIAVNVSLMQVKAAGEFVKLVTDTLEKWDLKPADLELDVTESMLARATLNQNDVIERLQKIGVKISIDDFGTKYSTLDYLKTYRVNRLKIPPALVASASRNSESAAMVRAIVGIARELNIEVIAQGVETVDQWAYLTATSPVTKVQGFYYSEPVPSGRAGVLLTRRIINIAQEPPSKPVQAISFAG